MFLVYECKIEIQADLDNMNVILYVKYFISMIIKLRYNLGQKISI